MIDRNIILLHLKYDVIIYSYRIGMNTPPPYSKQNLFLPPLPKGVVGWQQLPQIIIIYKTNLSNEHIVVPYIQERALFLT